MAIDSLKLNLAGGQAVSTLASNYPLYFVFTYIFFYWESLCCCRFELEELSV